MEFNSFPARSHSSMTNTGTFAGVTPVAEVDGRTMASAPGPIVKQLQALYKETVAADIRQGRRKF
jgi:branched-chain amino acid aminotransferase